MYVDRHRARKAFEGYVSSYDPKNPRIALKIAHTYRVAELCDRIAPEQKDLAWLCGLLHDIGRFEQVRRFDTFNDSQSVPHARLGVDVLFGNADPNGPQIRRFVEDDSQDERMRVAIATHSDYRLPADLDERTRQLCDVLRDADKIDIIKVNCICPIQDIYGVSDEDMASSELSGEVVDVFYEHRTIPRGIRRHPADILVGHICFAWELVYPQSRRIAREQGYLDAMLGRRFANERTQATFSAMAAHMRSCLEMADWG
ncbi:MAG: HD domain-containing protein [Atopobiaceae bacterium]|nr:HD domain-containing protein [Atopobiaceae bacterium]